MDDKELDIRLQGLLDPSAVSPPPVEDPNAVVGMIIAEPVAAPAVPPEFHVPTPDELRGFPPPPPIAPPPAPPAPPKGAVFPQATVMVDKSMHSGLVVGHVVEQPAVIADPPPPPPKEVRFDDLPEKTKDEIRGGWLRTHGTMDGFHFGENNTPPMVQRGDPVFDPRPVELPPEIDMSKLSAKTRAELEGGARRLAQRNSDYRAVLDRVNASNAAKHDVGGSPVPSNMDYAKGG